MSGVKASNLHEVLKSADSYVPNFCHGARQGAFWEPRTALNSDSRALKEYFVNFRLTVITICELAMSAVHRMLELISHELGELNTNILILLLIASHQLFISSHHIIQCSHLLCRKCHILCDGALQTLRVMMRTVSSVIHSLGVLRSREYPALSPCSANK